MDIFPIFAIGLGIKKVPEILVPARKLFTENKKMLKSIPEQPNHLTTLRGYKRNSVSVQHKDTVNFQKVKSLIQKNALDYLTVCGYDTVHNDVEVVNIWLNEMKAGCEHKRHFHYGYQMSGCYYVDVPQGAGDIMFSNADPIAPFGIVDSSSYTIFNSRTWSMSPQDGDMYFWRSDVQHQVLDGKFDGVRRSIAFDISVIERVK